MDIEGQTTKDVDRYRGFLQKGSLGSESYVVLLGLDAFDITALLELVQKGLSWKAFERLVRNTGLSGDQVGTMINVPKRTLARRKTERRFSSDESDRLLRAARVYGRALKLFDGDRDSATAWLTTRNLALGGVTPLEFMQTEVGANEVERVIGRAEYGVYS